MNYNKCPIAGHNEKKIKDICFDTQCQSERLCCYMCKDQHKGHFDQMVDIEYLIDHIKQQGKKNGDMPFQVEQQLKVLTKIQNQIDGFSKLIKIEVDRLGSHYRQSNYQKIGNTYNILSNDFQGMDNQKYKNLVKDMLENFKVDDGQLLEKQTIVLQKGSCDLAFLDQSYKTMAAIVNEFQLLMSTLRNTENINVKMDFNEKQVLKGHQDFIQGMDICSKRNLLVSGSLDKNVKLWDTQRNTVIKQYIDSGPIYDVVFSNQGTLLAYAGEGDYSIKVIDISDLTKLDKVSRLKGHTNKIFRLSFSNDSKFLISGSQDQTVRVWEIQSMSESSQFKINSGVLGVAIFFDDNLIASNSEDYIHIWNIRSQKKICEEINDKYGQGISFSNDNRMLITSHSYGLIKLWSLNELDQGKLHWIRDFNAGNNQIWTVLFSPCSKYIISLCNNNCVLQIMDKETAKVYKSFEIKQTKNSNIGALAISKDMNFMAYGEDHSIVILGEK